MKVDELIKKKKALQEELNDITVEIDKVTNLDQKACEVVYDMAYRSLCEMNVGNLAETCLLNRSNYELCLTYMALHVNDLDEEDMTSENILISKALSDCYARAILLGDE